MQKHDWCSLANAEQYWSNILAYKGLRYPTWSSFFLYDQPIFADPSLILACLYATKKWFIEWFTLHSNKSNQSETKYWALQFVVRRELSRSKPFHRCEITSIQLNELKMFLRSLLYSYITRALLRRRLWQTNLFTSQVCGNVSSGHEYGLAYPTVLFEHMIGKSF